MSYSISTAIDAPFDQALARTPESLAERGFGVLTEIDIAATLKSKLDVDVPAQVILGACRPELAHQAPQAEPSVGVLLPCNVVVRSLGEQRSLVDALDPEIMKTVADSDALRDVAHEARRRLGAALDTLRDEAG